MLLKILVYPENSEIFEKRISKRDKGIPP